MNINVTDDKKYTLVTIEAEKLGGVISPELKAKFVELNGNGVKNIVLDMGNARYCDSSGLSAILVGNRLCKNAHGTFVLCNLTDMVKKLVSISQLDAVLNIVPTKQEAIDYVMMEEVGRDLESD